MKPKAFLFIDPGFSSGAYASLSPTGTNAQDINIKDDIAGAIHSLGYEIHRLREEGCEVVAGIEKVASSPQQGSVSAFNFGKGVGALQAVLIVWQVQYRLVRPQQWQEIIDSGERKTPKLRKDSDLLDAKSAGKAYRERAAKTKAAAWDFAKRIFPNVELKTKTAHQDRADALCGVYWLSKQV